MRPARSSIICADVKVAHAALKRTATPGDTAILAELAPLNRTGKKSGWARARFVTHPNRRIGMPAERGSARWSPGLCRRAARVPISHRWTLDRRTHVRARGLLDTLEHL